MPFAWGCSSITAIDAWPTLPASASPLATGTVSNDRQFIEPSQSPEVSRGIDTRLSNPNLPFPSPQCEDFGILANFATFRCHFAREKFRRMTPSPRCQNSTTLHFLPLSKRPVCSFANAIGSAQMKAI
jgi:hypothetical protein